jgi:hypothetical protein
MVAEQAGMQTNLQLSVVRLPAEVELSTSVKRKVIVPVGNSVIPGVALPATSATFSGGVD